MENIKIKNNHSFNHGGTFEIEYEGNTYNVKWKDVAGVQKLETNAPREVYEKVYDYLFNY